MGKSPGKSIKGIIFGKKESKSTLPKGRELSKSASERPARISSKELVSTLIVDAPLTPDPLPCTDVDVKEIKNIGKGEAANFTSGGIISSSAEQDGGTPTVSNTGLPNDSEKMRLEPAAAVVQASFRGYQARRVFSALKGIIRLQSVVRGHLVRRQAVSSLFCVLGIVKFQALARGRIIRRSSVANEECRKQSLAAKDAEDRDSCEVNKYSPADYMKNALIRKLLSLTPTVTPLHLHYSPGEPNSAWDWLLRWSISQVWATNPKQKESSGSKHQTVETEKTKPKQGGQRIRSANLGNGPLHASSQPEKLKHNTRKFPSTSANSSQEHPLTRSDKFKCSSKKVPQQALEASHSADVDAEKSSGHTRKLSKSALDKPSDDLEKAVSKHADVGSSSEPPEADDPVNQLNNHLASEKHKRVGDNSHDSLLVDDDFKDEQISNQNHRSIPSYMATTASSKAKLRDQVSPRFGQDATDKNSLTRRLSLPSSTNGKTSSSPRLSRPVQANAKEGIKIDRSLSSSRNITGDSSRVEEVTLREVLANQRLVHLKAVTDHY